MILEDMDSVTGTAGQNIGLKIEKRMIVDLINLLV